MPRDLFRVLLDEHSRAQEHDMTGQIMSTVTLLPYDVPGVLMPVASVVINGQRGITLLSDVPIAANNQELLHATLGSPVRLKRSRTGRVEIVGLDKRTPGTLYNYTVPISAGMSAWTISAFTPVSGNVSAISARVLQYGELVSATSFGYGDAPYGAIGIYNQSGTLLGLT